jgi:hypothetical protein
MSSPELPGPVLFSEWPQRTPSGRLSSGRSGGTTLQRPLATADVGALKGKFCSQVPPYPRAGPPPGSGDGLGPDVERAASRQPGIHSRS